MDFSVLNPVVIATSLIVAATPLLFAAIGELVVEKSGVLNLGVEGMMIVGAIAGFATTLESGSAWLGVLAAMGGGAALAAIGLISFVGVAQVLPALVGGIFWRGATRIGAMAGLLAGFAIWAWTLFLPSIGESGLLSEAVLAEGPWGIEWLRPTALFGL